MSGTNYCKALVDDFKELAKGLSLDQKYEKHGRRMANRIFKRLQQNARDHDLSINRVRFVGSYAKGTCISYLDEDDDLINSDFDLVVFLNDEGPPFTDAINSFASILENMNCFDSVEVTRFSVRCIYNSEEVGPIKYDILPAQNFVGRLGKGNKMSDAQAKFALENLEKVLEGEIDPEQIKLHSAGFCEKTVDVIKGYVEDEFYLHSVRLAKYWDSGIDLSDYRVPGRSAMIEIMAISTQRGRRRKCLISGFRRFLEGMRDMSDQFHALFDQPVPDQIVEETDEDIPIICDPVNIYDNIAHDMDQDVIAIYKEQAERTLELLENFRRFDGYKSVEEDSSPIGEIFSEK